MTEESGYQKKAGDERVPNDIPEEERDYYLERRYPTFGNLSPRDISSRAAKERIDAGCGVGPMKNAVCLDFSKAIKEQGREKIEEKYGNLFRMYEKINGVDAYQEPMLISPAAHFTMGGLWVDYELMTTIPGLFALGEANFSDHGANRLGANSLLQSCVDGYFIAPYTIPNYLSTELGGEKVTIDHPAFADAEAGVSQKLDGFLNQNGHFSADHFHKTLGKLLYDKCGLSRSKESLEQAISGIRALKKSFDYDLKITGDDGINSELEKAGRVSDFLELGELMCYDALQREESCGAHFREEHQTSDGEAIRNDEDFCYVSAWEWKGEGIDHDLHKEALVFETVKLTVRSYK